MGKESKINLELGERVMEGVSEGFSMSEAHKSVVLTLMYFDIFQYPLTLAELFRCRKDPSLSESEVAIAAEELAARNRIVHRNGFFMLEDKAQSDIIRRRQSGNELAASKMKMARRFSRLISRFPYVRGVMISGSLSKDFMGPDADIDYFIVTQPGRLWVARTSLVLFKKIFLLNSRKHFCVNYFVDQDHLEIEDKNIFTATETVFILPTYSPEMYHRFREQNAWAVAFYPAFGQRTLDHCAGEHRFWLKRLMERMWAGRSGTRLDDWCMKRTLKRWESKFGHMDEQQFEVAMRTRKHVSKHHPSNFQTRVMEALNDRIAAFETQFGCQLKP